MESTALMPPKSFVHLHLHTHYSLLDGATRIGALIDRAKQFDMPAVAITDHGNLFGAIEFYEAARKAGIKPIVGLEAYLARGHRTEKEAGNGKEAFHLLLLAMNRTGYQNLLRLSSIGYTEGFYRKPRIDKEVLREFSEGLICTSTCIGGEIPYTLLQRDRAAAESLAKTYLSLFGPDRFFIELQDHGMPEQRTINPELLDMARRLGVAVIATNDVHYLEHDDVEAHDVLCCINTGAKVADEDRFKFPTDQFYFKNTEEMAALFPACPEAIENTLRVADLCNLELDLAKRHAPVFRVPETVRDEHEERLSDAAYLRRLVYGGARERYGEMSDELRERIDYELDVITGKGFASYFLIVWDAVNYARTHGIPVGARGSGCSSVVAYCLRISSPEPIRYGLYFERFMDPDRDEMPDIDLDICQNGRAELIDYVRQKYGHVAQIITFGTLKAKAVVKDVARVLGLGFDEANGLTKLIPFELKMTLDRALSKEPELRKRYEVDPTVKRIIDIGRRLEGVARNAGVHAAGVVIADQPLVNFLPLCKAQGQDKDTLVTQFDGPTVERVGLLKMDFLGLRTLTTLERARQLAEKTTGQRIDLETLDLTDQKVYELFTRGDTKGVFQFESGGMRDALMRMRPNRIEDLIAANALYRPGPMEYIPEYIARKHGRAWTTAHSIMTEILSETYGIMVYQEQVARLVNRLGDIERKAAFRLAKAISKKKTSMIEAMREPFLAGCEKNGVPRRNAGEIFEDILKFGGYAFNKAHSTGYALVAYQTAWMKTYHPLEFMAALMTFEMGSTDKIAEYCEDCKGMGITVDPPNINASAYDFTVARAATTEELGTAASRSDRSDYSHRGAIRFGLGAIKGVGAKAVATITQARTSGGAFKSIFDFCERVDLTALNRATIEALICAGAFDVTGAMRKALMDAVDRAMTYGQSAQRDRLTGQLGLFGDGAATTISEPVLSTAEWTEAEMLAREKAVLGFYITRHPLAAHARLIEACATASTVDLQRYEDGTNVVLGGIITAVRFVNLRSAKNSDRKMGLLTFEDLKGRVEAVLFHDKLNAYRSLLALDTLVFLEGAVDKKREEPSVRVSRIVSAEDARQQLTSILLLTISPFSDGAAADDNRAALHRTAGNRHAGTTASSPANSPSMNCVESLLALLRAHRGETRVYLNVETAGGVQAQIECHASLKVACSPELLAALFDLLGRDNVCLLGPARRPLPLANASPARIDPYYTLAPA